MLFNDMATANTKINILDLEGIKAPDRIYKYKQIQIN